MFSEESWDAYFEYYNRMKNRRVVDPSKFSEYRKSTIPPWNSETEEINMETKTINGLILDLKEIASDGEALIYSEMVRQPIVQHKGIDCGYWVEDYCEDASGDKFWTYLGRCSDGLYKPRSSRCRCDYELGDFIHADDEWNNPDFVNKFGGYINKIDVVFHRGKYCWAFWVQPQPYVDVERGKDND